ncbi:Cysteine synthase [Chitinispirillum alkaliphilum]|nr:Cysteine synthase [Chitinispirillum alkaliphilum]
MNIYKNISSLVGNTPLVQMNRCVRSAGNLVAAKLEYFNPCGSVKDRAALGMIEAAEESGSIRSGSTIIEATSGNTGISLAFIAAERGYRLIVVMPDSMSVERRRILAAFGVQLELTPAHEGMQGSIERAQQLAQEIEGAFLVSQFNNPANPAVHEKTTAQEILRDTEGGIDIFVAGVGTGGTLTGVGKVLKEAKPEIKIIAVEPCTSNVLSGGPPGPHMIQGIGAGFIPEVLDRNLIDQIVRVSDSDAFTWTRKIMREEGISAGISSGAALCGAYQYLKSNNLEGKSVVVVFPDAAERYLTVPMLFSARG